jgi:DivIVA domain-containing protein
VPLTLTEVANKQFRIAFRGYSLDEVDSFLDEVEAELSRLLRDNSELKNRPVAPVAPAAPELAAPEPPMLGMQGQEAALRTLLLAQRTADQAIAEARAEAEQIVSAARSEAETTVTAARSEAQSAVAAARGQAESTMSAAKSRTARLEAEMAAQVQAATGNLEDQRRRLEGRIEELRAFEREYRTRLKAYLQNQLRDLDSRTGPDDAGAGVPAGARTAAVDPSAAGQGASRGRGGPPSGASPLRSSAAAPARPEAGADGSPDGPPREAPTSRLRAVQGLATSAHDPVGPFAVDSRGRSSDGEGGSPTPR